MTLELWRIFFVTTTGRLERDFDGDWFRLQQFIGVSQRVVLGSGFHSSHPDDRHHALLRLDTFDWTPTGRRSFRNQTTNDYHVPTECRNSTPARVASRPDEEETFTHLQSGSSIIWPFWRLFDDSHRIDIRWSDQCVHVCPDDRHEPIRSFNRSPLRIEYRRSTHPVTSVGLFLRLHFGRSNISLSHYRICRILM